MSGDSSLEQIVRAELTARISRLDREGWRDLRNPATAGLSQSTHDGDRIVHVERMTRFIGENALDDIAVKGVAAAAGHHPNCAVALFKRAVGMTINQSIVRHRLDAAQSMLIGTDRPIAAIAFDCGFGSLSPFYEAFHQRFRTSPALFRKNVGGTGHDASRHSPA